MIDPAFGMNNFNTPKYYNESQTTANNIIMILEGRPGFYPSIPELGMNIRNLLYKNIDEIIPDALKNELARQCNSFISNISDGSFDVQIDLYKGKPLLVFIIPVTIEKAAQQLAIGVTTNAKGELIYDVEYASDNDYMTRKG